MPPKIALRLPAKLSKGKTGDNEENGKEKVVGPQTSVTVFWREKNLTAPLNAHPKSDLIHPEQR